MQWRALFRTTTHSYDVDERGLARVLEAHERQLHLLLPEEALEPLDDSVYKAQHLGPPHETPATTNTFPRRGHNQHTTDSRH